MRHSYFSCYSANFLQLHIIFPQNISRVMFTKCFSFIHLIFVWWLVKNYIFTPKRVHFLLDISITFKIWILSCNMTHLRSRNRASSEMKYKPLLCLELSRYLLRGFKLAVVELTFSAFMGRKNEWMVCTRYWSSRYYSPPH